MKRITYIFLAVHFVLIFSQPILAQLKTPPKIEWQHSLGGSGEDRAWSIQQTGDSGYIVAGNTYSFNGDVKKINDGSDYWIIKLSSSGTTEWKRLYGGNGNDGALSIRETNDGSYIIAGYSHSDDVDVKDHIGASDFWVVSLTDSVLNWEKSYGGTGNDEAISITPTFDSGYIAVGDSYSTDGMVTDNHGDVDYWIVKLASNGVKEWARSYGGSDYDLGKSIQQTSDSGYIVAGYSFSNDGNVTGHHGAVGSTDYWIIKLSKEGNIEWQRSLGGSLGDGATDIRQSADGGYIVVGYSQSIDGNVNGLHGGIDMWVIKLSSSGSIEWDRSLGGTRDEVASSVCETSDGGYVIAGVTNSRDGNVSSYHGGCDYWLVKLSNSGILEWERSLGGSKYDWAYSIQQTADGGFIVAGYSYSNDGDVTGHDGTSDSSDYWIVKLSPENPSNVESESTTTATASITPNPASTSATLMLESDEEGMCEVQIISVTGVTLKQQSARLTTGKQEIALTGLESLPSGMYEVLVKRGGYLIAQTKLIIE